MTTKDDLKRWFEAGVAAMQNYMIVVCDSFSYEDYPVYAITVADFDEKYDLHNGKNMQRVMEVYDLSKDPELQLKKNRSWEYPVGSRFNPKKNEDPIKNWLKA